MPSPSSCADDRPSVFGGRGLDLAARGPAFRRGCLFVRTGGGVLRRRRRGRACGTGPRQKAGQSRRAVILDLARRARSPFGARGAGRTGGTFPGLRRGFGHFGFGGVGHGRGGFAFAGLDIDLGRGIVGETAVALFAAALPAFAARLAAAALAGLFAIGTSVGARFARFVAGVLAIAARLALFAITPFARLTRLAALTGLARLMTVVVVTAVLVLLTLKFS